jgi:hypothetical protein
MKSLIQLEELLLTIAALYFLSQHGLGISAWWWALLFFSPDISMLGYLLGPKAGAVSYNLFHHKGLALGLALAGYFLHQEVLLTVGTLLFAHSSFDRMMGYGLKYFSSFQDTHLGPIGSKKASTRRTAADAA